MNGNNNIILFQSIVDVLLVSKRKFKIVRMDKFYKETLANLEAAIKELEIETDCSIHQIEVIIKLIIKCLSNVKEYVLDRGFKNVEEEICFFKHQKPAIFSKLIYYNAIYKIETKKPYGGKAFKKYYNDELE